MDESRATGLSTTTRSSSNASVLLLYIARCLRGFGDGFAVIILPAYLSVLGYTPGEIGFIASASLLGTAALTLAIGLIAPRFDLRTLLLGGAALMVATGIAYPAVSQIVTVAIVAFIGTINPSTGDLGVLIPIEHAMLARNASDEERTHVFARYSLIGALSMAAGSLAAALPDWLTHVGMNPLEAFQTMFYAYAVLGLASAAVYRFVPHAHTHERATAPLGPSRGIVYKLAALFSIDAFAGGFAVQSLMALWLFQRFDMSLSQASVFFFWASTLSAFSYPLAARIATRIGLVNTMVFTHIPSSAFLILAALSPSLPLTLALLLARAALSQMDVPTRTSYVMAVVTPAERPAAASVTAIPRSLASSLSPTLGGILLAGAFSGLPLVICGALKIGYDVALLYLFRHVKPPEELQR
jgi:MFS family permease